MILEIPSKTILRFESEKVECAKPDPSLPHMIHPSAAAPCSVDVCLRYITQPLSRTASSLGSPRDAYQILAEHSSLKNLCQQGPALLQAILFSGRQAN
jgi:hypothetical protein